MNRPFIMGCPLCSRPASWKEIPYRGTGASGMEVPDLTLGCKSCDIWLPQEKQSMWEPHKHIDISDKAKQSLIDKWNRRANADGNLQSRVAPWMQQCFGAEISADKLERGDRLLEEVLELLQSGDYPAERVLALRDYVWNRPKGAPHQEVGGTMITLAAYCLAHDLDMHAAGEDELRRINRPAIIEKIRAKQAAKPTGSALPI